MMSLLQRYKGPKGAKGDDGLNGVSSKVKGMPGDAAVGRKGKAVSFCSSL